MPNMLGTCTQPFNIFWGGGAFLKAGQVSCKAPSTTGRPDVSHSISFPAFVLTNNRIGHQVSIRSTRKAGHWLIHLHPRMYCSPLDDKAQEKRASLPEIPPNTHHYFGMEDASGASGFEPASADAKNLNLIMPILSTSQKKYHLQGRMSGPH